MKPVVRLLIRKPVKESLCGAAYLAQGPEERRNPGEISLGSRIGRFASAGFLGRNCSGAARGARGFWLEQLRAAADGQGLRGAGRRAENFPGADSRTGGTSR